MLILSVVTVYALPLDNENENVNENLEIFEDAEAIVDFPNELIRDKRQYGGKKNLQFKNIIVIYFAKFVA